MTGPGNDGIPQHAAYEVVDESAVEPKTKAATVGASAAAVVTGFVLYLLDALFWNGDADPPVPLPVSLFVGLVIAAGITFASSYAAKHVNR